MIEAKRFERDWNKCQKSAYMPLCHLSPMDLLPNEKPLAAEKFAGAAPAESEQF